MYGMVNVGFGGPGSVFMAWFHIFGKFQGYFGKQEFFAEPDDHEWVENEIAFPSPANHVKPTQHHSHEKHDEAPLNGPLTTGVDGDVPPSVGEEVADGRPNANNPTQSTNENGVPSHDSKITESPAARMGWGRWIASSASSTGMVLLC